MGKSTKAVIIIASALCFLSLLGSAYGRGNPNRFDVKGIVYCDTCRTQFMTRVSELMAGAKVRLECKDRENGNVTFKVEGETNKDGAYSLPVEGDHEEEVCEIVLLKSTKPGCEEVSQDANHKRSARVSLTNNNGIVSASRMANPLGFMKKEPLPECTEILKELGITPDDLV